VAAQALHVAWWCRDSDRQQACCVLLRNCIIPAVPGAACQSLWNFLGRHSGPPFTNGSMLCLNAGCCVLRRRGGDRVADHQHRHLISSTSAKGMMRPFLSMLEAHAELPPSICPFFAQ
jgi:hypothetical protein